jgi:malate synthase
MATEGSSQLLATPRLRFAQINGAAELFTPAFVDYLVRLHDEFTPRIHVLRAKRADMLKAAHEQGIMPTHLPVSEINTGDWKVPPVPADLLKAGIEISGPASITHMFINALNPGRCAGRGGPG